MVLKVRATPLPCDPAAPHPHTVGSGAWERALFCRDPQRTLPQGPGPGRCPSLPCINSRSHPAPPGSPSLPGPPPPTPIPAGCLHLLGTNTLCCPPTTHPFSGQGPTCLVSLLCQVQVRLQLHCRFWNPEQEGAGGGADT